jgi:hypothetical protein
MRCPMCPDTLTLWEYLWSHTHQTREGRILGAFIMFNGVIIMLTALVHRV